MELKKIFNDTAYVRMGGSDGELRCAEYLASVCAGFGGEARLEAFPVNMAAMKTAKLTADGREIPCKGYFCAGSGTVEAPFYYLTGFDDLSLSQCRGKIVMIDGYMGYWKYQDVADHGAVGFITYDGHVNYADRDMDQRELRSYVAKDRKLLAVNINVHDAIALADANPKTVTITLDQDEWEGRSHNVVLDLPGEIDEWIVLSAHYDTTSLSMGAYDNMSGSAAVLAMMEHFAAVPHRRGIRMVLCGSEERGLLGSKAYVADHAEELGKIVLNVNLDMVGSIMGKFHGCVTGEDRLCSYLSYLGDELGLPIGTRQGVYPSDSTPFADAGVPAVSFARMAPNNTATIHNRYDTAALLSMDRMDGDIRFIQTFVDRMAAAAKLPVKREIPQNMKEKLDEYLYRKRPKEV